MPRLAVPADNDAFSEGTRRAIKHILDTRGGGLPAPSSLLTYAEDAGSLLSDLVEHLRYHTSLTNAETELAICTSARASNSDYIWNAHTRRACVPSHSTCSATATPSCTARGGR